LVARFQGDRFGEGREAAPLRKGLFAIVLVAAAFAGGAAVNGPGLQWAKSLLFSQPPSGDETEDPSDLVQPSVGPVQTTDDPPASQEKDALIFGDKPKKEKKEKPKSAPPGPKAPEPSEIKPAELKAPDAGPAASDGKQAGGLDELPPLTVPQGQADAPPELRPPSSPSLAPASLPALEETPPTAPASRDAAAKPLSRSADQPWGDLPGSAPAAAIPPKPHGVKTDRDPAASTTGSTPGAPASPGMAASRGDGGDWAEIRRKMRELGVSRYGIEGEPGGRVRFHCIIPVAGRRAVGQHFEAEGDDELQAAATTLRRVALWRATDTPGR